MSMLLFTHRSYFFSKLITPTSARSSFSSIDSDHSIRRHRKSPVYTKPFFQTSPHVRALLYFHLQQRILPLLNARAVAAKPVDVLSNNFAFILDFVSSFLFGLSRCTNFMQLTHAVNKWFESYAVGYAALLYWLQEFPFLVKWMRTMYLPLVTQKYFQGMKDFDQWIFPCVGATVAALT